MNNSVARCTIFHSPLFFFLLINVFVCLNVCRILCHDINLENRKIENRVFFLLHHSAIMH